MRRVKKKSWKDNKVAGTWWDEFLRRAKEVLEGQKGDSYVIERYESFLGRQIKRENTRVISRNRNQQWMDEKCDKRKRRKWRKKWEWKRKKMKNKFIFATKVMCLEIIPSKYIFLTNTYALVSSIFYFRYNFKRKY